MQIDEEGAPSAATHPGCDSMSLAGYRQACEAMSLAARLVGAAAGTVAIAACTVIGVSA